MSIRAPESCVIMCIQVRGLGSTSQSRSRGVAWLQESAQPCWRLTEQCSSASRKAARSAKLAGGHGRRVRSNGPRVFAALSISSSREIPLRLVVCHPPHEFRARVYFQLPVDASQVELDCLRGDEERCSHVPVRLALGDETRDLQFLRRKLFRSRRLATAQRQTGCSELGPRALRPRHRSPALEGLECSAEMHARVASVTTAAKPLAEAELGSRALERARVLVEP